MSYTTAGQWVKFFNASGIPSPSAATYAHIFVENRIQIDMLTDLNKEYLREMGISLMGDIIAILRHAKQVTDQTARDKILSTEMSVPVATVAANPVEPLEKRDSIKTQRKCHLEKEKASSNTAPLSQEIGLNSSSYLENYKKKRFSGKEEPKRVIHTKDSKFYFDRESADKSQVFDRLSLNRSVTDNMNNNNDALKRNSLPARIVGIQNLAPSTSSIFSRLGVKATTIDDNAMTEINIKPILKNSTQTRTSVAKFDLGLKRENSTPIIKRQKQKVLLVKKVPLKVGSDDDCNDTEMYCGPAGDDIDMGNSHEKFVKFASTAEVREIASSPHVPSVRNSLLDKFTYNKDGVKSRLGSVSKLRAIKKTYNFKTASTSLKARTSPVKANTIRLKSDEMLIRKDVPIHKRLGDSRTTIQKMPSQPKISLSQLTMRMEKLNAPAKYSRIPRDNIRSSLQGKTVGSVFDRLGFNSQGNHKK